MVACCAALTHTRVAPIKIKVQTAEIILIALPPVQYAEPVSIRRRFSLSEQAQHQIVSLQVLLGVASYPRLEDREVEEL